MGRVLVCLACLASAVPAFGQTPATIHINYVNAELGDVIRSLAVAMGVNVVLTDVPARRITFQTPEPVPASQAGAVLEGILQSQGLVLVQTGPVVQVMPEDKRPSTGPLRVGKEFPSPPPLGLVTQVVPLDYMRADEAVALLREIADKLARIEVVPRSNAVLITDRGVNVARYLDLLRQVDVKTGGEAGLSTYVYPLKHANAAELATTLGQVFGVTVAVPQARQRVQALEGKGLASSLQGFQQQTLESVAQRGQTQVSAPVVTTQSDSNGNGNHQPGNLLGSTMIVPDQATNALVIRTAAPNFSVLQGTIEQLDVRPAQVLLEVLIAEVELDKSTTWGVNWSFFNNKGFSGDSTRGILGTLGSNNFTDSAVTSLGGLGLRVINMTSTFNVAAVLQALSARTNVRVLSAPHVLALNNEKARILVGSQVPFTSATITGITASVDQVVQYQNVGTQLTVLPTINNDGYVTFRILQEVSELSTQTIPSANNANIITTREAETSALVKSGHTVVIGGLIGSTLSKTSTGIPLLEDIPLLGNLFRSRSTDHERTELAIFMTPYVVYTDEQTDSLLTQEKTKMHVLRESIDSVLSPSAPKGKGKGKVPTDTAAVPLTPAP